MKANMNHTAARWDLAAMMWALAAPVSALSRHVWTNSPNEASPYTNWSTAARTITAAVQVAVVEAFTILGGSGNPGGGIYCAGGMIDRCLIVSNGAFWIYRVELE